MRSRLLVRLDTCNRGSAVHGVSFFSRSRSRLRSLVPHFPSLHYYLGRLLLSQQLAALHREVLGQLEHDYGEKIVDPLPLKVFSSCPDPR